MNTMYYYLDEESQQIGPLSMEKLLEMRKAGIIADETLVWTESWEAWYPLLQAFPMLTTNCEKHQEDGHVASREDRRLQVKQMIVDYKSRVWVFVGRYKKLIARVSGIIFFLLYPIVVIEILNRTHYAEWEPPTAEEIIASSKLSQAQSPKVNVASENVKQSATHMPEERDEQGVSGTDAVPPMILSEKDQAREQLKNMGIPVVDYEKRLFEFAQRGNLEYVRLLIQAGARVNTTENVTREEGRMSSTPLAEAAYNGHTECVEEILKCNQVDVKLGNPVYSASVKGHLDCLKLILKRGGSVNEVGLKGDSPLIAAASAGNVECIKLLMQDESLQPNHTNDEKNTALFIACKNKYIECVKLLLDIHNIDVNSVNGKYGWRPIQEAVRQNNKELFVMLMNHGDVDIHVEDDSGRNLVHIAMAYNSSSISKILFETPGIDLGEDEFYYGSSNNYMIQGLWIAREKRKSEMRKREKK